MTLKFVEVTLEYIPRCHAYCIGHHLLLLPVSWSPAVFPCGQAPFRPGLVHLCTILVDNILFKLLFKHFWDPSWLSGAWRPLWNWASHRSCKTTSLHPSCFQTPSPHLLQQNTIGVWAYICRLSIIISGFIFQTIFVSHNSHLSTYKYLLVTKTPVIFFPELHFN